MPQQIRVGSTVRFLNATGGGIVRAFRDKDTCIVEDETGFEVPILIRDVVVVEPTNEYNFVVDSPKNSAVDDSRSQQTTKVEEDNYLFNDADETPKGELLSIYLAFLPVDVKRLQTTDLELFLINDSNYYLDFVVAQGLERVEVAHRGTIEPQTKLFLQTVSKEHLNDWEVVHVQALPYKKQKAYSLQHVVDIMLKINTAKFFKLHAFKENDFFDDDALLFTVLENGAPDIAPIFEAADFKKVLIDKEPQKPYEFKKPKKQEVVEIDLHINALLDNTNNLSRGDMLNYQLDKFRNVMNQYVGRKGQRIVFIHGKGEGVLRKALLDDLKRHYPKCRAQDASFQQYGFGATMVIVG